MALEAYSRVAAGCMGHLWRSFSLKQAEICCITDPFAKKETEEVIMRVQYVRGWVGVVIHLGITQEKCLSNILIVVLKGNIV